MSRLALGLVFAGCSFAAPVAGGGDGGDGGTDAVDSSRDGGGGETSGALCLGETPYELCVPQPEAPLVLPASLDTGTSLLCEPTTGWVAVGQPDSCFVVATAITMQTDTVVTGPRPLVLVARDAITISAVLDVASHRGGTVGPGVPDPGNPIAPCLAFVQNPGDSSSGAAGGAGASFMTKGGNGGDGNANNNDGRAAPATAAPLVLRAGCNGQRGGEGDGDAGNPGRGGGVVYLVSNAITITGVINASGSGSSATTETKTGGSGGGSGGMIKLHASVIAATGTLMANGGGGASGAGENNGGAPGTDPLTSAPTARAPGGSGGGSTGGGGFAGTNGAQNALNANVSNTGGGGGGGGGGFIQSNHPLAGATVSAGAIQP